jgi:hypothetical protein
MSLEDYTTAKLMEEIAKRSNAREAKDIKHWCEDCDHFVFKPNADWRDNPCGKKHKVKFHVPADWGEMMGGHYGFYRLVCCDRTQTINEGKP